MDARNAIEKGFMTGTVKQDAKGMADAILTVADNFIYEREKFSGIDEENISGGWKINIPYSKYTGSEE